MQWIPESINELNDLLNEGLFEETHYRDAKRQIKAGVSGSKELARDLASFAIDGGLLFVGVAESVTGQFVVEPQDLRGVAERIEQVARTRVSPPLTVRTVTLLSAEDSTKGVLVVVVPPSPVAPHMVDHKYLGRGDKTKYELDDAEVLRLHERRKLWERSADTLLDEEMARVPYGVPNERPHLFIVAEPVGARPDGLLAIVPDDGWIRFLMELVNTRTKPPLVATQFSPTLSEATHVRNRPGGWGLSTYGITGARTIAPDSRESSELDLELRHNGGVRLFCGRLVYQREEGGNKGILDAIAFGLFQHVLQLCKTISDETEFLGSWDIGCAMTNIRGTISYEHFQSFGGRAMSQVYSEDGYRRVSRCTFEELAVPDAVTERVLGAFMRALGTRKLAKYASYFPN